MKIHIVQKGDTLWKIAKKYGVNFEELKKMNSQLSNPDMIMPGMKIKVPTGGGHIKKEAPVAGTGTKINMGTKKEMPKKEYIKELPKENIPSKANIPLKENIPSKANIPLKENIPSKANIPPKENITSKANIPLKENVASKENIAPKANIPLVKKEKPKKPFIPKIPKPTLPEIDINNYYLTNVNLNEPANIPPPAPAPPPVQKISKKPPLPEIPEPEEMPTMPEQIGDECPPMYPIAPAYSPCHPVPYAQDPCYPVVQPIAQDPCYPVVQPNAQDPCYPVAQPNAQNPYYPVAQPNAQNPYYPVAQPNVQHPYYPVVQPNVQHPCYPVMQPFAQDPCYPQSIPFPQVQGAQFVPMHIASMNQGFPMYQTLPANQAMPIANQAMPIANQAMPIANQAMPGIENANMFEESSEIMSQINLAPNQGPTSMPYFGANQQGPNVPYQNAPSTPYFPGVAHSPTGSQVQGISDEYHPQYGDAQVNMPLQQTQGYQPPKQDCGCGVPQTGGYSEGYGMYPGQSGYQPGVSPWGFPGYGPSGGFYPQTGYYPMPFNPYSLGPETMGYQNRPEYEESGEFDR